jgi:hypothetical protein
MSSQLDGDKLIKHVRALADEIGPRPAGSPAEAQAQQYVRKTLQQMGIQDIETLHFRSPDTWGYALMIPALLALAGNGLRGRLGRLISAGLSLTGAYLLLRVMNASRVPLIGDLAPTGPSSTQLVRIPAVGEKRHTLVLIGHVDANKHRPTFGPSTKRFLRAGSSAGIAAAVLNGLVQIARAVGPKRALPGLYRWSLLGLVVGFLTAYLDDQDEFIPGANDNATAVACLLGLAAQLRAEPLAHTEVWLVFTGAEETGCLGTHALLDAYGEQLRDAYFLDFEMVGAGELAYVTHHSSFSYLTAYTPDPYSAALAARTARQHPEFKVTGRPMVMTEEVGALRSRGFRGLCLVGVGDDGFLVNWHQRTDISANIVPAKLEKAARFALAYMQELDRMA